MNFKWLHTEPSCSPVKEGAVQQGNELAEGQLNLWVLHVLLLEQSLTRFWLELQLAHDE